MLCEFLAKTYVVRAVGLLLIAPGLPVKRTADILDVTAQSVNNWRRSLAAMTDYDSLRMYLKRPDVYLGTKIAGHEAEIIEELESKNYQTVRQVANVIKERWNIDCSSSPTRAMLHALGCRRLKAGSLPAKADPAKQRAFFNEVLRPLMERAHKGEITLYFLDASHFVHGCDFLGNVWCRVQRYVKTYFERNRYNVLGALNYAQPDLQTVTDTSCITGTEVCELFKQLAKVRAERDAGPIYVVLDNARYQKCKLVTALAEELGIHLVYLPLYSPNLNLIERHWKLVKGELCLRCYDDFESFTTRITEILDELWTTCGERIRNLLTEPQLIDLLEPVCENTYQLQRSPRGAA